MHCNSFNSQDSNLGKNRSVENSSLQVLFVDDKICLYLVRQIQNIIALSR